MNYGLTPEIIEDPSVEPITVAEAKTHLRVDGSDEDSYISALIIAAREEAEAYCQRSFVQRTYKLTLEKFPAYRNQPVYLPMGPVQSVTSIKYYDTDSTLVTWASANYIVDTSQVPARIAPIVDETWPSDVENRIAAVEITYVAGYAGSTDSPTDFVANVPKLAKQAMLYHIGHMYENRQDVVVGRIMSVLPGASKDLLCSLKVEAL